MPRPPDDNAPSWPTRKPKRTRCIKTPRRIGSDTLYIGDTPIPPELRDIAEIIFKLTPIQFLGLVLKLELGERITDRELLRICETYRAAVRYWGS
jgi:hypothetical protein